MTIDEYLRRVSRGLAGMDPRVREDVLRELRSHLSDASAEMDEARAIAAAEPPAQVAARYKDLDGYGRAFQAVFVSIASVLAVLTLPLLLFGGADTPLAFGVALGFLLALVAFLMWVAVRAGSTVGLVAGVAACVTRFASVAALGAFAGAVVAGLGGWTLFALTSALLILIGWVPGRAKERWTRRDVGL